MTDKYSGQWVFAICPVCFERVDLRNSEAIDRYPGCYVCKDCVAGGKKPQYTANISIERE